MGVKLTNLQHMLFYSEFQHTYLWLPLAGFIIGMIASMVGSGGGFFFPLLLILFFQIPAHIAVATSLAASLPLCIAGTTGHYRRGNINLRLGFIFGAAGILGALSGAFFTRLMQPSTLKIVFGIYSVVLALIIFYTSIKDKKREKGGDLPGKIAPGKIVKSSFFGYVGGAISGTFGTSGAAPIIAGLFALKTPVKKVAGTSLMVVLINTLAAFASHFLLGEVDLTLVLMLTAGSVMGALLGPRLLVAIKPEKSENLIRRIFAIIIIISGILLIIN